MKTLDEISPQTRAKPSFARGESSVPAEKDPPCYVDIFVTKRMREARGPWDHDALSAQGAPTREGLNWSEAVRQFSAHSKRSPRQLLHLAQRMHYALTELKDTVEIDPERQNAIPVLAGTRFRVSQLFGEIADSDAIEEVAEELELDLETIRRLVHAMAIFFDKPVTSTSYMRHDPRST